MSTVWLVEVAVVSQGARALRRRGPENGRKDVGVGWAALGHDFTVFAVTATASAYKPLIYSQTMQRAQTVPKVS